MIGRSCGGQFRLDGAHVHPNTVDFRLERIAQLTGLDTAPSKGLWHLRSALVAHSYLKTGSNR